MRVVAQKGDPDQIGEALRTDTVGKAYKDSERALKNNARSVAKIPYYVNLQTMRIGKPKREDGRRCFTSAQ